MKEKDEDKLSDYGRFRLIEALSNKCNITRRATLPGSTVVEGSNDTLVSQFLMLEGMNFNMAYTPPAHLGYKAVVTTLAGLTAAGLTAGETSLIIGISSRHEISVVEGILEGAKMAGFKYGFPVISFDIIGSATGLSISITSWGFINEAGRQTNSPAVNDLICVSGNLGASFAGLQILERERRLFGEEADFQPDLSQYSYVVGRQLKPELRTGLLEKLAQENMKPTASVALIEGVASDIIALCNSRGVGARIYLDRLPIDAETAKVAEELNMEVVTMALNGGEDFEYLFTFPISLADRLREVEGLHVIGYITDFDSGHRLILGDGAEAELTAPGWV